MRAGKVQKFDYGTKKNMEVYGQPNPPEYPIENLKQITIPKYLFYSPSDPLADIEDVNDLIKVLHPETTFPMVKCN